MKKVFKIVGIVAIVVVVLVCLFGGILFFGDKLEKHKLDNDRINHSKTLSQYVKYHGLGYVESSVEEMYFHAQDIKCDLLKDKNILYYGDDFLVLDDYTIYETAFTSNKTYSNGQQCKRLETDIEIDRIQIAYHTLYFISKDNKYYTLDFTDKTLMKSEQFSVNKMLLDDETIIKYVPSHSESNAYTSQNNFIVLKNDGKLYEYQFDGNYKSTTGKWEYNLLQKQLLSNQDYGRITDFVYSRDYPYHLGYDKELDNEMLMQIVSDKGLYYLKQTSEQQYIDTEPTYELVASDIYNKYKADIKFIDSNYLFTTDNNIIRTEMLCRDIDKEVK